MEKPLANQTLAVTSVDDAAFKKVSFVSLGVQAHPPSLALQQAENGGWSRGLCLCRTPQILPPVQAAKRVSGQRTIATLNSLLWYLSLFKNDVQAAGAEFPHTDTLLAPAAHSAHAQEVIFPLPQINDKNRRRQVPGFAFRTCLDRPELWNSQSWGCGFPWAQSPSTSLHHPHYSEFEGGEITDTKHLLWFLLFRGLDSSLPLKIPQLVLMRGQEPKAPEGWVF